jgi:hypothetical protein
VLTTPEPATPLQVPANIFKGDGESTVSTYSTFKTNPTLESEGVVVDFGDAGAFRIARAGGANQRFHRRMATLTKPHRQSINLGTISQDVLDEITRTAYAETIIIGWERVTDEAGQPLTFSKDNCMKLLADLPELFGQIIGASQRVAYFKQEMNEAAVKNS